VRSLLGKLTPCEGIGQVAAPPLKKEWLLEKEVNRWTLKVKDVVAVVVVGARDAVAARATAGSAGVVNAVAVAAAAAAVDRSHALRSRRSRWLRGLLLVYSRTTSSPCLPSRPAWPVRVVAKRVLYPAHRSLFTGRGLGQSPARASLKQRSWPYRDGAERAPNFGES
jgi:hypothetical protein